MCFYTSIAVRQGRQVGLYHSLGIDGRVLLYFFPRVEFRSDFVSADPTRIDGVVHAAVGIVSMEHGIPHAVQVENL